MQEIKFFLSSDTQNQTMLSSVMNAMNSTDLTTANVTHVIDGMHNAANEQTIPIAESEY